jgi:hypothetical protein
VNFERNHCSSVNIVLNLLIQKEYVNECDYLGAQSIAYEDASLLGYGTVLLGEWFLTF